METRQLPPSMMCQICHRPIEHLVTYDSGQREVVEYHHSRFMPGVEPHEAVPVPNDYLDQVSICDLCGQPGPIWEYPVVDFEVPIGIKSDGRMTGYHSLTNWYACDACKNDTDAERWSDIWPRWLQYQPEYKHLAPRARRIMRTFVENMHAGFRANRQGDPWLIGSR